MAPDLGKCVMLNEVKHLAGEGNACTAYNMDIQFAAQILRFIQDDRKKAREDRCPRARITSVGDG
jgi:hypothetical protein